MSMLDVVKVLVLVILAGVVSSSRGRLRNENRPYMQTDHYQGRIDEDTVNVILEPPLYARDKDSPKNSGVICDYELIPGANESAPLPFEAFVLDPGTGQGTIQLRDEVPLLDCRRRDTFEFFVVAVDCGVRRSSGTGTGTVASGVRSHGQRRSKRSRVTVRVVDVNDHAPVIETDQEEVRIESARMKEGAVIRRMRASDEDCSDVICSFDIQDLTPGLPFNITDQGEIYATRSLAAAIADDDEVFELTVTASDCRGRTSDPEIVRIVITAPCAAGWIGLDASTRVQVPADRDIVPLFARPPALDTCLPADADVSVDVVASLEVEVDDAECDADDINQVCGHEADIAELLPLRAARDDDDVDDDGKGATERQPETEEDGSIYDFSGTAEDAIALDEGDRRRTFLDETDFVSGPVLVTFNMFLASPPRQNEGESGNRTGDEPKMTVLCKSDERGHNRHHFAIYVQRCHIMLLLRNGYDTGDGQAQYPAEWHWKLTGAGEETDGCYGKWYRVAVAIDGVGNATLSVDGEPRRSFLVADDYRLHRSRFATRWSIGAAWQGKEGRYEQAFRGRLSQLMMSRGDVISSRAVGCFHLCREGIRFRKINSSFTSSSSSSESAPVRIVQGQQQATVSGPVQDLSKMLGQLSYLNRLDNPTPLRRRVIIETLLRCDGGNGAPECPRIETIALDLEVKAAVEERVYVVAPSRIDFPQPQISARGGVRPFTDVVVKMKQSKAKGSHHQVKLCVVKEKRNETEHRRPSFGRFHLGARWLRNHKLVLDKTNSEVALSGVATIDVYQEGLRSLSYENRFAQLNQQIHFTVNCYAEGLATSRSARITMTAVGESDATDPFPEDEEEQKEEATTTRTDPGADYESESEEDEEEEMSTASPFDTDDDSQLIDVEQVTFDDVDDDDLDIAVDQGPEPVAVAIEEPRGARFDPVSMLRAVGLVGNAAAREDAAAPEAAPAAQMMEPAPAAVALALASEGSGSGGDGVKEEQNRAPLVVTGVCIVLFVTLAIAAIVHTRVRGAAEDEEQPLTDDYNARGSGEAAGTGADADGGMDWDDSAMTITVNPMMDDPDTSDFSDFEEDSEMGGMMVQYHQQQQRSRADGNNNEDACDVEEETCRQEEQDEMERKQQGSSSRGGGGGAKAAREKCMSDDFYEWDA